jgi:glucosamine-6-phosphate deaminase
VSRPLERTVGEARVVVHPDTTTMARAAAEQAAAVLRGAVEDHAFAHAMFATGNSQLEFVERLTSLDDVPWDRTVIFHMDEYIGVGPDEAPGFQHWIRTRITHQVHPRAAYYLEGLADPISECDRYGELLREFPLDLCCLGIGENGHLAFNDPPVADFDDRMSVKVVELDEKCRQQQIDEGHFPDLASVPSHAMTVTIPALLRASQVLAIVPEQRKATPVRDALTGPISTDCPASVLRRYDHVTVHLDPGSASLLDWG